jgi:SAM-dependent methyltransferase
MDLHRRVGACCGAGGGGLGGREWGTSEVWAVSTLPFSEGLAHCLMPEPEPELEPEPEPEPAEATDSATDSTYASADKLRRIVGQLQEVRQNVRSVLDDYVDLPEGCICPVVSTPEFLAQNVARLAHVGSDDLFPDLGCGDGRVVTNIAQICGCRSFGVDIRPEMIASSQSRAEQAGPLVATLCEFSLKDFQQMRAGVDAPELPVGLGGVTVIFTYLLPEPMRILDKLLQTAVFSQGARVATFMAHPQGNIWRSEQVANTRDLLGELQLWERSAGGSDGSARATLATNAI